MISWFGIDSGFAKEHWFSGNAMINLPVGKAFVVVWLTAMARWWNALMVRAKKGVVLDIAILLVMLMSEGD